MTGLDQLADTYWITDPAEIACLASPRRQEIVDALVAAAPLSAAGIGRLIGLDPHGVYHHLRKLQAVGLVIELGKQAAAGRSERLYAPRAKRLMLRRAFERPANRPALKQAADALCRQLARDVASGFGSDEAAMEGPRRNLTFVRHTGAPTADQLRRINRNLDEISEIMWESTDRGSPSLTIGWISAPTPKAADGE